MLPQEWITATIVSTINMRLTVEQLREISQKWDEFIDPFVLKYRGQNPAGSRPVQIHFNAFPVIDGEETP